MSAEVQKINQLEEGTTLSIDFDKLQKAGHSGAKVVPVVVQDADSLQVLVVAYANQEALDYALTHRVATFWSTSRGELWIKGATSGDKLELVEVRVNCEQNSLLYLVRPLGEGVCHTKGADGRARASCYYRRIDENGLQFVDEDR
jgi:phosphoribosyl-AMP cyclohydrolase